MRLYLNKLLLASALIILSASILPRFFSFNLQGSDSKSKARCITPDGVEVDWYSIFLMNDKNGKYSYFDDKSKEVKTYPIDKQFPPLQLAVALNEISKINYIVWNDETIKQNIPEFSTQAHSKGILVYDSNHASYLVHSLPKFPYVDNAGKFINDFPPNKGKFAQTFMCITVDFKNTNKIIQAMKSVLPGIQMNETQILPESETTKLLSELVNLKRAEKKIENIVFQSLKGKIFNLFTKPNNADDLPWDNQIPNFYKQNLFVGTWTRPKALVDVCATQYKVRNILNFNVVGMKYTSNQDHSKWAVGDKIFCNGDLNRTASQSKRSGSVICFEDQIYAKIAKGFVEVYEKCEGDLTDVNNNVNHIDNNGLSLNILIDAFYKFAIEDKDGKSDE